MSLNEVPIPQLESRLKKQTRRTVVWLISLLVFLFVALCALALLYYHSQRERTLVEKENELTSIAQSKAYSVSTWRNERLADAVRIRNNPLIYESVQEYFANPQNQNLKEEITAWLENARASNSYSFYALFDAKGNLSISDAVHPEELETEDYDEVKQVLQKNQVQLSDLHFIDAGRKIRMDLLAPVSGSQKQPIAVVMLRVDPYQYLYLLIQSWPIQSQTAETILFRKDGNNVLYLNDLRFSQSSALTLTFPISAKNLPAAMALRGEEGPYIGDDYRGIPVVAVSTTIPDTDWYMIAKEDQSEVFAEVNNLGTAVLAILVLLLMATFFMIYALIRRQRQELITNLLKSELEKERIRKRYSLLFDQGNDIVLVFDTTGRVIDVNDRALEAYNYTREELLQMNAVQLRAEEMRSDFAELMEQVKNVEGKRFESIHQRKDGTRFPVEVSSRYFEVEQKGYFLNIARDISERMEARHELQEAAVRYRMLFEVNPVPLFVYDSETLEFLDSNEACTRQYGYSRSEFLEMKAIDILAATSHKGRNSEPGAPTRDVLAHNEKHVCKDGRVINVEATTHPLIYNDRPAVLELAVDVTQKVKAENELAENLNTTTGIIETSPLAIITTDREGNITLWNKAAEAIFGWTRDELLGKPDPLLPADSPDSLKVIVTRITTSKVGLHYEATRVRKDGGLVTVDVNAIPLHDYRGRVKGLLAILSDITALKAVEAENQKLAEERYQLLTRLRLQFSRMPISFVLLDQNTKILDWNPQAEKLFGYSRAEVLGKNEYDLILPPEARQIVREMIEKVSESYHTEIIHHTNLTKSGERIEVEWHNTSLFDESGDFIAIMAMGIDVTEKVRAEREIREKQELLKMTGTVGKIGGWETDALTGQGSWTEEVARIHDVDLEKEPNVEFGLEFYTEESRPRIAQAVKEAIEQGKPYDLELEIISAKGVHKLVRTSGFPEFAEGRVVRLHGIFQDITDLKKAEAEVRKLNEELEQRVKERTAELTIVNQELESFSYSVSHDLRAPIRAIDGFSQIILEDYTEEIDPTVAHYLELIRQNTRNMGNLVDDLLAFSRLGRQAIQKQKVNVQKLVSEVVAEIKVTLPEERKIEFIVGILPECQADVSLLRQVFVNLIANAVKFTRKCDLSHIEIGTSDRMPPDTKDTQSFTPYCYYVRDNGVGFDMRYYNKLFGVFQRLHRAEEYEGTGVGLAIVKRVIEKHGGRVWAESELDKGTTFYFVLGKAGKNDQSG